MKCFYFSPEKIISIIIFILLSVDGYGQDGLCPKSTNKKAVKYFQEAMESYKARKYEDAKELLSKTIDADPEFADAYLLQGNIALKRKEDKELEANYKKVIELCPDLDPEIYFQLGWMYFELKKWSDCEDNLKQFLEYDRIKEDKAAKAENMLSKAHLIAHPVPFNPVPVSDISTADPEYLPYISPDNELAFFTRRFEMTAKNMLTPQSVEKFMIAHIQKDGKYDRGKPMEDPFNKGSSNNEGGATITIDNKHLFFTVNVKGNFDICTSDFKNGLWTEIRNLGPEINDPKQWDAQPTISSNGKTLYFASARDPLSGIDIYKTEKDDEGNWKKAVRLGNNINTNGNDKSPFMHSDSKTFYFSSDSLPGLGGYDIYKCQMDENGNFQKPVNLGYPINTEADEVGFFVSLEGKKGYFASNKLSKTKNDGFDIYSFDLYPEARPNRVYFQKGDLNGPDNKDSIPATIQIKTANSKKITQVDVDSVTGEYAFVVDFKEDLLVSIKKEGYAFQSQYVSAKDTTNFEPKKVDIELKKLEVGKTYEINDILFATNSYEVNDTIKTVLDEFIEYLKVNPKLIVAIQGHTDNIGKPADNMILSQNRAKAVADYLVSHAISPSRISHKGFGETVPVAGNDLEKGRAKNRRTVFVVTSK